MSNLNLHTGGSADKRRSLDFYPTPPDVTHALMKFVGLPKHFTVWEPACGDGAMSRVISQYCEYVISTDIATGNDFLLTTNKVDAIITNPPFNLSEAFIRRSLGMADVVCMLLKSQYWHAKKRLTLFNENPPAYVLPLTWRPDFMGGERGGSPTMDVAWSVWIKGSKTTVYHPLKKP